MQFRELHPWKVSPQKAMDIQTALSGRMDLRDKNKKIKRIAGTDVSSSKRTQDVWAGVVVLTFPGLERVEERWAGAKARFPYIPGLLSFREIPPLLTALEQVTQEPDLVFCDGQGIAHPRGLGLAAHLGILLEKPTIGCAKRRLVGIFGEVGSKRGDYAMLRYKDKQVGAVLRTRSKVKPVFVSPGYGISIRSAVRMTLQCGGGYRIPEPTRQAHLLVNKIRKQYENRVS